MLYLFFNNFLSYNFIYFSCHFEKNFVYVVACFGAYFHVNHFVFNCKLLSIFFAYLPSVWLGNWIYTDSTFWVFAILWLKKPTHLDIWNQIVFEATKDFYYFFRRMGLQILQPEVQIGKRLFICKIEAYQHTLHIIIVHSCDLPEAFLACCIPNE